VHSIQKHRAHVQRRPFLERARFRLSDCSLLEVLTQLRDHALRRALERVRVPSLVTSSRSLLIVVSLLALALLLAVKR
jgi:hypothetical protein